jgi:hypothetical protein
MKEAPRLAHDSDGLVMVQLGEHSVLFPSEADARFFFGAYTDVPNLVNENASLRAWINEGALHQALARVVELEAQAEQAGRAQHESQERRVALCVENKQLRRWLADLQAGAARAADAADAAARQRQADETSLAKMSERCTALASEIALLERDRAGLLKAQSRAAELAVEVAALKRRQGELEAQLTALAGKEAIAVRRARILALAVKNGITPG